MEKPTPGDERLPLLLAGLLLIAAVMIYFNSLAAPFVFDDGYVTTNNPTIRSLWPLWEPLSPPANSTSGGRPLLNLSLALNYAVSGLQPWSYHAANILIHWLAALTLFGIVRRTFRQPVLRKRFGTDAKPLALAVALLWLVHPLQTESVTYISQRAEALMSLFYLLTLYTFIRGTAPSPHGSRWLVLCVTACLAGMGTKEVMVTAPLLVLLYDRTFVAGSFHAAWRMRWKFYLALATTWLWLAWLLHDVGKRSVGLGLGVSPWSYLLTQCRALVRYLQLTVWPHPLVIDYGTALVHGPVEVWWQGLILVVLLVLTVIALVRWPVLGFVGACFFLILAPTSSVVPLALEPIAEHRMYLPLAPLFVLLVAGLYLFAGKKGLVAIAPLAVMWGALTIARNEDYRSAVALWHQTVLANTDSPRAHNNYGEQLLLAGYPGDATVQFQVALMLQPNYPEAENNWGFALAQAGLREQAGEHYRAAMAMNPAYNQPHNNYGLVLLDEGRLDEAITQFQETLRLDPTCAEAENNWGNALLRQGHREEALSHYEASRKLNPAWMAPLYNEALALKGLGRGAEARALYEEILQKSPGDAMARENLEQLDASPR